MDFDFVKLNTFLICAGVLAIIGTMFWMGYTLKKYIKDSEKGKENEILFDMCLNAGGIGTWQYNIKEDILLWSQEMIDLFGGINVSNLQEFLSRVHPEDLERIQDACLKTIKTHVKYEQDYRIIIPDGSVKTIEARGEVYKGKFLGIASDITQKENFKAELLKKTEELEVINQELTKFAYITSHDLKAPLRALTNLSKWVLEEVEKVVKEPSEDLKKYISLIQNRTQRMENLIDGILEYSRVGRYNKEVEDIDLNQLIGDCIDIVKKDKFEIIVDPMPNVRANRIRMMQIFTNLLNNSIKHHDKTEGKISIKFDTSEDNFLKFRIVDDGPGIPEKYHKKIFEIFQTLNKNSESTGLGLTLVKKIIEEKGGEIGIISDGQKGCEFWFKLPKKIK